jgi:hypothetical protein
MIHRSLILSKSLGQRAKFSQDPRSQQGELQEPGSGSQGWAAGGAFGGLALRCLQHRKALKSIERGMALQRAHPPK